MKLICIGDSLTFGYGLDQKNSWFTRLAAQFEFPLINAGVPGNTTAELLARFDTDVLQQHPTHVLIMGGTNDIMLNVPLEETLSNLKVMMTLARKHHILPIIMFPIPINTLLAEKTWFVDRDYHEANLQLETLTTSLIPYCEEHRIRYIDLYHLMTVAEWQPHYLTDGLHIRAEGHKQLFEAIHPALTPLFSTRHPLPVTHIEKVDTLKYLQAYVIHYKTKSGKNKEWELVSRGGLDRLRAEIEDQYSPSDGSVIFATTPEHDQVILLREYRVAAGRYVYMLPAGLSDDGEDVRQTAVREFKEETGLDFEPVHVDPARYVSIGIINEKVSVVYGYFTGTPSKSHQADNEDADIIIIDRNEAIRLLAEEEVAIRTSLLLQGFFNLNPFFQKH